MKVKVVSSHNHLLGTYEIDSTETVRLLRECILSGFPLFPPFKLVAYGTELKDSHVIDEVFSVAEPDSATVRLCFPSPPSPQPSAPASFTDDGVLSDSFSITSVEPNHGPISGGQKVKLCGNFPIQRAYLGTVVKFGESAALWVEKGGDGFLFVITPPHTPGPVLVRAFPEGHPQLSTQSNVIYTYNERYYSDIPTSPIVAMDTTQVSMFCAADQPAVIPIERGPTS